MNPDRQQAIDYLRAPVNGLWRWAEDGVVLAWHDGSTIAFREEIVQIIEWLAPNGLPSFGAVVFLLAACRGKVPSVADIVAISNAPLPTGMGKDAALLLSARRQLQAQVGVALTELVKVSQLPSEINSGIKAKCVLAEAVFEPAKVERYVEARAVLRGMREPMSDSDLIDGEHGAVSGSYVRQIHLVAEGLKLHTVDSLTLRMRTGLDALPTAPDLELPAAERARRLIDELSRDREHGAVARAARELMAAVRLPRRLAQREELAIGGVADITNRGPLDRLLLSELAHDDLTLSVRVALNEALYLRREPPMREPPGTLALLLDSGVRLWGIPRVIATAVALALIARDKQHSEVLVWRGHGKQLQSVDLLSRNGLTQHLGVLEPNAHPGESVPAFVDALANDARNQSVLITHRDTLADAEFRRSLVDNPAAPGFVATVDRDGRFELHSLPLSHRPAVCEADLDLTALFTESAAVPPIKVEVDPDLPAIFGITPFPFLLPVAGSVDFWIKGEDGYIYAVTNDQRLLRFKDAKTGARVLASNMPPGKTMWMDCTGGVVHIVKAGASQRPTRLLSLSLPYGQLRVTDLVSGPEVCAVHRYGEAIVVIRGHDVRAHALGDGRQLGHAMSPHLWVNGRYFRGDRYFHFAVWDGERVKFEPVTTPYSASVIATIFDRQGLDPGPWVVHRGGRVFSLSTDSKVELPMPQGRKYGVNEVRVSRDGNRVFFSLDQSDWRRIKDLESGAVIELSKSGWLDLNSPPPLQQWNVYRVIEAIGWINSTVALRGRKERWRLFVHGEDGKFKITDAPSPLVIRNRETFKAPRQSGYGCAVSVALYSNGSKVFLDSRGLLHFKSSDPKLPEVSLVLADGEIAGWTSDGHVCGPQFFFDTPIMSEPKRVFEHVTKFFENL
jgi:hypothetical protein